MRNHNEFDGGRPTPEMLMAYADGEVDVETHQRISAWLETNPEGREEVEAYRDLDKVWADTRTPAPGEDAWKSLERGIRDALAARPKPSKLGWKAWFVSGVAAAAVFALLVTSFWPGSKPSSTSPSPLDHPLLAEDVLPVAASDEIEILSMNPEDGKALPVGQPLELEDIDLVSHEELTIVEKADPELKVQEWGTPMIVDPEVVVVNSNP